MTEERFLRLENTISTLAELAAEHQRLSVEQQRLLGDQQRRTARLEESLLAVIELTRSNNESIDELRAAQANSEHKIADLADTMINLAEAQTRLAESQKQLAESQTHSDKRLDALIDIVREWRNGRS